MDFINLGYTDRHSFCCGSMKDDDDDKKDEKVEYPCLYVYDAPKELLRIEGEGEAVIRYKVKSRTESTREGDDGEDEDRNSIDIEIRDFKPIRDDKKKKPLEIVELTEEFIEKIKIRD